MALELGTTDINRLYLGGTEINKAYLGGTVVYDKTSSVPTDLEIYFRFQNSLADFTGNHSPTGNAAYTYQAGLYGGSKCIDANINGLITVADSDNLSFTNGTNDLPFSVSFAVRLDTLGFNQWILTKQLLSSGFLREYDIYFPGNNKLYFILRDSGANSDFIRLISTNTISINTTTHYVVTYDGSESQNGMKLYVNGVEDTTVALGQSGTYTGMGNSTANMTLLSLNGGNGLRGRLDYFGIYRRELSAAEALALYNENSAGNETI